MYKKIIVCFTLIFASSLFSALNRASLSDLQVTFKQLIKASPQKNENRLCEILETIFKDPIYTDAKISVGGLTVQQWVESALAELTQSLGRNPRCALLQQMQKQAVPQRAPLAQPQEPAIPEQRIPVPQQPQPRRPQASAPQETKENEETTILLESCQAELDRLRAENARLKTQLDQLQQRGAQLINRDELKRAQDLTAQFQQQLTIAQQELEKARTENEQLRRDAANRINRAEFDRLRTQLETQIKDLQQRLNQTQQELTKAQTDLKNAQEELKKKPKEVIKEVIREVRVEDTARIQRLETETKRLQAEITKSHKEFDELEKAYAGRVQEQRTKYENAQREGEAQKIQITELTQKIKQLETQLVQMRTDLETARQAATQAEQKVRDAQKHQEQIATLQQQLNQQKNEAETQRKKSDEQLAKAHIDAQTAQQAAIQAEQKAKNACDETITALNQQIGNARIAQKQAEDEKKKCEEALAQRPSEKVWQEVQSKAQQADALNVKIGNLTDALTKLQQKYDTETLTMRAQLENAKNENLQRVARETDAERALSECKENLEKMSNALAEARARIAELEKSEREAIEEAATVMEQAD